MFFFFSYKTAQEVGIMERQQFEQTLDTIIAYRAEYRSLDAQASAFHIRENTAAEYFFYDYPTRRMNREDSKKPHIPLHELLAKDNKTKEALTQDVIAYVRALPHFDLADFQEKHPSYRADKEVEPSFRRPETFAAYSTLLSYVQDHIPEMLEQYTWDDMFKIVIPRATVPASLLRWHSSEDASPTVSYETYYFFEVFSKTIEYARKIVSRDISTTAHALSENSTMLSCSLDPKEQSHDVERAVFYAPGQEHAASFRLVVPHISLEAIAALEHPFSVSVASGIISVSGVDIHSKEHRDALYAFIQQTDALSDTLRREHRENDVTTLETDLHTYRHAFYDARNIGEYTRALQEKLPPPTRKWYAGPAVLEVEDALQAAYHLAAEKQKQCEEEVQRQQKYLRLRYGILRIGIDFSHPCDDYSESSKVHFKDCVIEDASHKQLVTKTVAYYTKTVQKGD